MPDDTCQVTVMKYSEASATHPIPAEMTQFIPQEPEQEDSCGIQSPAKPSPVPSAHFHKKHPHGQGFCVEMEDTNRQGFPPAWSPSGAGRAHYKEGL